MHVAISVIILLAAWIWGDWKNWQKYHTTMLFIAVGNLLYNFLCANHLLWKINPDILSNHTTTEMLYTFIVFPATAFLFLSNYPEGLWKQVMHISTWIGIYVVVEWLFIMTDRIVYQYGWGLGWSALFDLHMFPILRLYYKKPLIAYALSIGCTFFWVWLFDIPVGVPIEER
jgi:hypothetical protein